MDTSFLVSGSCENGSEMSGYTTCRELPNWLRI
jgi:hypothetical protein